MSKRAYILRILLCYLAFLLGFLALGRHLYGLQISRHEELAQAARATYMAERSSVGRRGSIVDRHGNVLAGNIACKDVLAEPRRFPPGQVTYIRDLLASRLNLDWEVLDQRFRSGKVEVVVTRGLDMAAASELAALKLPGIRLVDRHRRYYPKGPLLANVLGFTDDRGAGAQALEKVWDDALAPRRATWQYERNRKGQQLHRQTPAERPALDGHTVVLTIDEPLQSIVENELATLVAEHQPKYAYAIMVRPQTGEVLAVAQQPSFDPNDRSQMDPDTWRCHFLGDVYDPGSTMKPIAIAGAIDYGVVTLDTKFDCEGGRWYFGGKSLRDSHGHGLLSVLEIIKVSSNIGTAKIAIRLGKPRLYQTMRRFGFGSPTELGLHPESRGILRRPEDWWKVSISRIPIGQGISVTPLQMVQAYCALGNEGRLPQLHLVKRIVDERGQTVEEFAPPPRGLAVRPEAARAVVRAMKEVTEDGGTAERAAIDGYHVAGKTGTSQKCIDGSYTGHGKYVASFIGFVPAEDPAFALLVVADEPGGRSYYGGTVCGPTFQRIGEQALRYLNVPPEIPAEGTLVQRD